MAFQEFFGILSASGKQPMIASLSEKASNVSHPKMESVAATILSQFFDELAKDASLSEMAPALRKVVIEQGVFAEPAVRAALFPDAS